MTTFSDSGPLPGKKGPGSPLPGRRRVLSSSPGETERLGAEVGGLLGKGPALVLLSGELGTGKTTFIRGLARGLGIFDPDSVRSPSYTLVIRYPGKKPLTHMDAYFMRSAEDLDLCGFDDALARGDVVAVEWADRIHDLLFPEGMPSRSALKEGGGPAVAFVSLDHGGEDKRWIGIDFFPAAASFLENDG